MTTRSRNLEEALVGKSTHREFPEIRSRGVRTWPFVAGHEHEHEHEHDRDGRAAYRGELRVVIANGAGTAGLASRTAKALEGLGYTQTYSTDSISPVDETVIYFAPGFREAAVALAEAMQVWAPLEPKPGVPLTPDGADADADLVAVLGRP